MARRTAVERLTWQRVALATLLYGLAAAGFAGYGVWGYAVERPAWAAFFMASFLVGGAPLVRLLVRALAGIGAGVGAALADEERGEA